MGVCTTGMCVQMYNTRYNTLYKSLCITYSLTGETRADGDEPLHVLPVVGDACEEQLYKRWQIDGCWRGESAGPNAQHSQRGAREEAPRDGVLWQRQIPRHYRFYFLGFRGDGVVVLPIGHCSTDIVRGRVVSIVGDAVLVVVLQGGGFSDIIVAVEDVFIAVLHDVILLRAHRSLATDLRGDSEGTASV